MLSHQTRIVAAFVLVIASCFAAFAANPASAAAPAAAAEEPPGSLSAGGQTSCEVRADASAWCWGDNRYGQIGDGTNRDRGAPFRIGAAYQWRSIDTGGSSTCGIQVDGSLWCWGANHRGQLGNGTTGRSWVPVRIGAATQTWTQVAAGWANACAVASDGGLWCWGDNHFGQLGQGDTVRRAVPTQVGTSKNWLGVSVGGQHACGALNDGRVTCWGRNDHGQLGLGHTRNSASPRNLAITRTWASVSTGWRSTCAIDTLGAGWCWGDNSYGQLGVSGATRTSPVALPSGKWSSISPGDTFTCGTNTGGAVYCWGSNRYGQLGDGQALLDPRIRKTAGTGTWTAVEAGWHHVCGRKADGTRQCWGNNEQAQLGIGGRVDRSTPAGAAARTPKVSFRKQGHRFGAATFNILGSQHTEPGGGVPDWAPGRLRAEWAADLITGAGSSIVAIQESQVDQLVTLEKILGSRFEVWPGTQQSARHGWQSVLWDRLVWKKVRSTSIELPVLGRTRPHPLILLQHKKTGRKVWVFNIHNSSRNTKERIRERARAMKLINKQVRAKRRSGTQFLLLGDFNDRRAAFCSVAKSTDLVSVFGGSYSKKKGCRTPRGMGIDWIFHSPRIKTRSATRVRSPWIRSVGDHPIVRANLTLPR